MLLILNFKLLLTIKEVLQESLASLLDSSLAEDFVSLPLLLDDASSSSSSPSSSVRLENLVNFVVCYKSLHICMNIIRKLQAQLVHLCSSWCSTPFCPKLTRSSGFSALQLQNLSKSLFSCKIPARFKLSFTQ